MRAVFLIVLGIVIGSTLSTMIALAWDTPTASPPGNNVSSPINVGSTAQLKNGTLGVNGLGVFGNTILNGINGDNNGNGVNSYLNFGATAGQSGYGIRDNNGTLEFKNNISSWGSLNVTLTNLMQVNGITTNGLGQVTSIKFGDGTTQTTAVGNNTVPIFRVDKNGVNQGSITATTFIKVTWPNVVADTRGNFNTTTSRYTPTVAGYYQLTAALGNLGYSPGYFWCVSIYENAANVSNGCEQASNAGSMTTLTSTLVYANGTSDYFEVYIHQGGTATTMAIDGAAYSSYFTGFLVAPKM